MNEKDTSSGRTSAALFLTAGMIIIAVACWELLVQTELREERKHSEALLVKTTPPPAERMQQANSQSLPAENGSDSTPRNVDWKQRLRSSVLKGIKLSIGKKRSESPPAAIPGNDPMK